MHIGLEVHFPLMGHVGCHVTATGTPTKDWQGPPWKKEGGENCHAWEQGGRGRLPQADAGRAAAREPIGGGPPEGSVRHLPSAGRRPIPWKGV